GGPDPAGAAGRFLSVRERPATELIGCPPHVLRGPAGVFPVGGVVDHPVPGSTDQGNDGLAQRTGHQSLLFARLVAPPSRPGAGRMSFWSMKDTRPSERRTRPSQRPPSLTQASNWPARGVQAS